MWICLKCNTARRLENACIVSVFAHKYIVMCGSKKNQYLPLGRLLEIPGRSQKSKLLKACIKLVEGGGGGGGSKRSTS